MNPLNAIVIGTSAGGLHAITFLVERIPSHWSIPILVVQHISSDSDNAWIQTLNNKSKIITKEGEDKEAIREGHIYIAPPDYHMLVNFDKTIALSKDEKVNFSRPSIDVLFESASDVYKENLAGILLTGSNSDGAKGLKVIKERQGVIIIQNPENAEYKEMPKAALKSISPDYISNLQEISDFMTNYANKKK